MKKLYLEFTTEEAFIKVFQLSKDFLGVGVNVINLCPELKEDNLD